MFIKKEEIDGQFKKLSRRIDLIDEKIAENKGAGAKTGKKLMQHLKEISEKLEVIENAEFVKNIRKEADELASIREKLHKQMESFKLLENRATKELLENVNLKIEKQMESLFYTTRKYKDLEESLKLLNNKVEVLSSELDKFVRISKEIKEVDFKMSSYAKQVALEDKEKLRLIRENDNLKRLISKERRKV